MKIQIFASCDYGALSFVASVLRDEGYDVYLDTASDAICVARPVGDRRIAVLTEITAEGDDPDDGDAPFILRAPGAPVAIQEILKRLDGAAVPADFDGPF